MTSAEDPYDGEQTTRIPSFPVTAGEWRVVPLPAPSIFLRKVHVSTWPGSRFTVGIFGREITAKRLKRLVGDPLAEPDAWDKAGRPLIEAWGNADESVLGEFTDRSGIWLDEAQNGWVWVAVLAYSDCTVSGELVPGIIGEVPNSPKEGSRIRAFRFDDDDWDALAAEAIETGEKDVSKVIRRVLKGHIATRERRARTSHE